MYTADHVRFRGMRLEYLPPYSPDLHPIEEAFSSIKAWLRSNRDYVLGELTGDEFADPYGMIWKAVYTVTPENAAGWFKGSGYIVSCIGYLNRHPLVRQPLLNIH